MNGFYWYDRDPTNEDALPGYGGANAKWMIVGPEPSARRKNLHPLGDQSLKMITRVARHLNPEDIYFTNLLPNVPDKKRKKLRVGDVRAAKPSLMEEIKLIQPDRILTVGADVSKALIEHFQDMREDHGAIFFDEELNCELVPTFMFSTGAQSPEMTPVLMNDLKRFFELTHSDPIPEYTCVTRVNQLPKWDGGQLVVDIETSGLDLTATIHYIGMADDDGNYFILESPKNRVDKETGRESIRPIEPTVIKELGTYLYDCGVELICHNTSFELYQFVGHDPFRDDSDWQYIPTIDTMLLAHNGGNEWNLRLKHLMSMYTNLPGSHAGGGVYDREYLALDLIGTKEIYKRFEPELETYSGQLMCDMSGILGTMRARGVPIDQKLLKVLYDQLSVEVEESSANLEKLFGKGVNWNSPAQVANALLSAGIPLSAKTKSGNLSVAETVLEGLAEKYPQVAALLAHRGKAKLYSGFVSPYVEANTAYVYPSLMLHGAETGRLSCRNPNLQQIPREGIFKQIFKSRWEGGLYALVDLDQAELRAAAIISGDHAFVEALLAEDAHRAIASIVFNKPQEDITAAERKASKAVTFGTLYGGTPEGLAARAGIPVSRADHVQKELFGNFPGLAAWAREIKMWVENERDPLIFRTPFGRKRNLTKVRRWEGTTGAYRKAINTNPQSLASDIMLSIVRNIFFNLQEADLRSRPLFLVHDSCLLEVYPGEEQAVGAAVQQSFAELRTPLDAYKMAHLLPMSGELLMGETWAHVESTNEAYDVLHKFQCQTELD